MTDTAKSKKPRVKSFNEILSQDEKNRRINSKLNKRRNKEKRFQYYGIASLLLGFLFLVVFFASIISKGHTAFQQNFVELSISLDEDVIDPSGKRDAKELARADYAKLVKDSLKKEFPTVKKRNERRELYRLVSSGASYQLKDMVVADT
ncbi:MAG: DUF3333 domain-containing protein, partial [Gammaproteobacteria bacterium]|nr:DUF3333 domain-containing protein [Gammaproteobacteria bacterium]